MDHGIDVFPSDHVERVASETGVRAVIGRLANVYGPGQTLGKPQGLLSQLCLADAKRSCLVVAPTIDLVNQWHGVLSRAFGGEVGMLGGGQHDIRPLTVSTYDSAYLHMDRYGDRCMNELKLERDVAAQPPLVQPAGRRGQRRRSP